MKLHKLLLFGILLLTSCYYQLNAQTIKGEVIGGANISQVGGDECFRYRKLGAHFGAGVLIPITDYMDIGIEILLNQNGAYKKDSLNEHIGLYPHKYDLRLNYAEIPVLLYLTDKARYSVGLGVSYGRLIGVHEYIDNVPTSIHIGDGKLHWKVNQDNLPDISNLNDIAELMEIVQNAGFSSTTPMEELVPQLISNSNTYNYNTFNLCADIRVRVWKSLHAELRYQYSLVPIRTRLFYKDANETLLKNDDSRIQPLQLQHNDSFTLRMVYIFGEDRSRINKMIQEEEKRNRR